jgi:type II secretory pathway component GspD/PulD (secretin)
LITLSLLCWLGIAAAQPQTEVIQITTRPAASLIEAVRPMLGESGRVSAFHDKLILNGSPDQLAAAKALIARLDRPARRLIIEVRQASHLDLETRRFGYGLQSGDVRVGRVPPDADARLAYQQAQTRGRGDATHRIQALDGQPALIMAGQSVPAYQGYQQIIGNTLYQGLNVEYRDAQSGFLALPRVHGDQVTVEIFQQDNRARFNNTFSEQRASTVLRGHIGEWLTLGSVGGTTRDRDGRIGGVASTRRAEDRQLMLRVLPVD